MGFGVQCLYGTPRSTYSAKDPQGFCGAGAFGGEGKAFARGD